MSTNCTYKFHTRDGQVTIKGMAEMKAFLATNGVGAIIKPPSKVKATARAAIEASAPTRARMSAERAPAFYSQLQRAIEQVPERLSTMAAPQWAQWLKANAPKLGVKQDEITWSGIEDYLKLRGKDKIDSGELAAWVGANGVQVEETVLGGGQEMEKHWSTNSPDYEDHYDVISPSGEVLFTGVEREADRYIENYDNGSTKYGDYTVPGGTKYRELLLTLPERATVAPTVQPLTSLPDGWEVAFDRSQPEGSQFSVIPAGQAHGRPYGGVRSATAEDARIDALSVLNSERENAARDDKRELDRKNSYKSSHWDQRNILAHVRVDERTDADGKRVLFVNELQSDWGQEGRKKGFAQAETARISGVAERDDYGDWRVVWADGTFSGGYSEEGARAKAAEGKANAKAGVPAAPFVTKTEGWLNLALKRIAMLAVEGGYDKVAFISGKQAADLYQLSNQIDRIDYNLNDDGTYNLSAIKDGREVFAREDVPELELEDIVGKEVAQKIVNGEGGSTTPIDRWEPEDSDDDYVDVKSLSGLDLEVGGEGMKGFYDQIVPQAISKLLPKLGGDKLGQVDIGSMDTEQGREGDALLAELGVEVKGTRPPTQPGFDVTDKMRDTVLSGVPLFSRERAGTDAEADVGQTQDKYNQRIEALRELVACLSK